eukprot:727678_1
MTNSLRSICTVNNYCCNHCGHVIEINHSKAHFCFRCVNAYYCKRCVFKVVLYDGTEQITACGKCITQHIQLDGLNNTSMISDFIHGNPDDVDIIGDVLNYKRYISRELPDTTRFLILQNKCTHSLIVIPHGCTVPTEFAMLFQERGCTVLTEFVKLIS